MATLVDSSVFIALERSGRPVRALVEVAPDGPVALACITASELLAGVHRTGSAQRRLQREPFVEAILQTIPIIPFDLLVARSHARLWAELARVGRLIGAHDLMIAATALTHGYDVLTENVREFRQVPGLVVHRPSW